jgi:hypothetical protein
MPSSSLTVGKQLIGTLRWDAPRLQMENVDQGVLQRNPEPGPSARSRSLLFLLSLAWHLRGHRSPGISGFDQLSN